MNWLSWSGLKPPTLDEVLRSMAEISSEKVSVSTGTFSSQSSSVWRWLNGDSCDATVKKIEEVARQIQEGIRAKAPPPPLYWKAARGLVRLMDAYENEPEKQGRVLEAVKKYLSLGDRVPNSSVGGEYVLITTKKMEELFKLFPSFYVEETFSHGVYSYVQNSTSFLQIEWDQMTEQQWRDLIDGSLDLLSKLHTSRAAHGAIDETAISVVGVNRQVVFSLTDRVARPKLEMEVQKRDVTDLLTLLYRKRFPDKLLDETEIAEIVTALGRLSEISRLTYRCIFNRYLRLSGLSELFPFPITERLRSLKVAKPEGNKELFVERLLNALQMVHSKGLCHGGVKPDCILWNNDRLTLEDFTGLSLDWFYCPPESLSAFRIRQLEVRVSKAADIWSSGTVIYELLFPPLRWMALIENPKTFDQAVALKASPEGYPTGKSDLEKLLLEMMNPDPAMRPPIEECLKRFKACKAS